MKFVLENQPEVDFQGAGDLQDLLRTVNGSDHTFAILEAENGHFIQTASTGDGYVIERQLGSLDDHYEAVPSEVAAKAKPSLWARIFSPETVYPFALEDVVKCFTAFMGEGNDPQNITWRKKHL